MLTKNLFELQIDALIKSIFFLWGAQNEAFCFLWTSYVATIILPHVSGSISEGIQGHIPTGGV